MRIWDASTGTCRNSELVDEAKHGNFQRSGVPASLLVQGLDAVEL